MKAIPKMTAGDKTRLRTGWLLPLLVRLRWHFRCLARRKYLLLRRHYFVELSSTPYKVNVRRSWPGALLSAITPSIN